jgi:hypothetical protein
MAEILISSSGIHGKPGQDGAPGGMGAHGQHGTPGEHATSARPIAMTLTVQEGDGGVPEAVISDTALGPIRRRVLPLNTLAGTNVSVAARGGDGGRGGTVQLKKNRSEEIVFIINRIFLLKLQATEDVVAAVRVEPTVQMQRGSEEGVTGPRVVTGEMEATGAMVAAPEEAPRLIWTSLVMIPTCSCYSVLWTWPQAAQGQLERGATVAWAEKADPGKEIQSSSRRDVS